MKLLGVSLLFLLSVVHGKDFSSYPPHQLVKVYKAYQEFMGMLADHIQVLGPVLSPYLAALVNLLPKG